MGLRPPRFLHNTKSGPDPQCALGDCEPHHQNHVNRRLTSERRIRHPKASSGGNGEWTFAGQMPGDGPESH